MQNLQLYFTKACLTQFKSKYYFHQRIIFVLPWKSTGNMLWNCLPSSKKSHNLDERRWRGGERITVPSSRPVVLNWGQFGPLGNIWQWLETVLVVTFGGVLLASSGYKSGMLLSILQCTRQLPKNYLAPNVNMLSLRNLDRSMDIAHNLHDLTTSFWYSSDVSLISLPHFKPKWYFCLFVCLPEEFISQSLRNLFSPKLCVLGNLEVGGN